MTRPSSIALAAIFLTVAFTVLGQLLVKQGMAVVGKSPTELNKLPMFALSALLNPKVFLGLSCAVVAALTWLVAVSRSNLSFAYPFMALAIVLVLALSGAVLHESVPLHRWFGVGIVVVGLIVASRG